MQQNIEKRLKKVSSRMDSISAKIRKIEKILSGGAFIPCTVRDISWDPKTKRVLCKESGKPLQEAPFSLRANLSVHLNDLAEEAVDKAEDALERIDGGQ